MGVKVGDEQVFGAQEIKIKKLFAANNAEEGLEVDNSDKIVLEDSTFLDNFEGIDIDDTEEIKIKKVVVLGSVTNGLEIDAKDDGDDFTFIKKIKVEESTFSANGGNGIEISEQPNNFIEKAELKKVTTSDNLGSGLNIDMSGELKLDDVDSDDNGLPDVLP